MSPIADLLMLDVGHWSAVAATRERTTDVSSPPIEKPEVVPTANILSNTSHVLQPCGSQQRHCAQQSTSPEMTSEHKTSSVLDQQSMVRAQHVVQRAVECKRVLDILAEYGHTDMIEFAAPRPASMQQLINMKEVTLVALARHMREMLASLLGMPASP